MSGPLGFGQREQADIRAGDGVALPGAPSAEPLDLKRVHHGAYVDLIFENAPAEGRADAVRHNVWPLLASGRVRPIIRATFPLAEAPAAHQLMESSSHIGKIVLTVP